MRDTARYAELFRTESRELLAEMDGALLALERAPVRAHVTTLFRGMHTIKGMAAAMGYDPVERVANALESRCEPLRAGEEPLNAAVISLLFDGTDVLRQCIEAVESGATEITAHVHRMIERLAVSLDGQAPAAPVVSEVPVAASLLGLPLPAAPDAASPDEREVAVRLTADCPLKGVRAMLVLAKLQRLGSIGTVTPPQPSWQDDGFEGAFTVTITSSTSEAQLEAAARSAGDVARVAVSAVLASGQRRLSAAVTRTVRIDARRLDALLELAGELVITRDRLLRTVEGPDYAVDSALVRVAHDTARLVRALQDEVLQARMLPVAQVFDRFPRLVRDIARELGKNVEFLTEGREIELDRSLLEAIGDPIMHLLRNALDHGFEDAATRRQTGKPVMGQLILRAVRDRASVVIQVQDDGRGIDRAAVLRKAHEHGLVTPTVHELTDAHLLEVVSHPGLSTTREVTSISGRGVGVDVVNTRVRALGGVIELETIAGEGTVFTMRLPVTLAIARALLVQVGDETYAIPAVHVIEAVDFDAHAQRLVGERRGITVRDEFVPLVPLSMRFREGRRRSLGEESLEPFFGEYVAIVESSGRRAALLVDALVAQQDIVVKPFDSVRGAAPWFSGATVLGDGSPALIVDVSSVV